MVNENDKHTFVKGDRFYCNKKEKYGSVLRTNPFGMQKSVAMGVKWDNTHRRDVIFGNAACCALMTESAAKEEGK